jgi:3D (Asp-Asp-Asp) domain-containing protein
MFSGGDATYVNVAYNGSATGAYAFATTTTATTQLVPASPQNTYSFVCQMVNSVTASRPFGSTYLTLRWVLTLTGPSGWNVPANSGRYNLFLQDVKVILNSLLGIQPGDITINNGTTTSSNTVSIDHTMILPPTAVLSSANATATSFAASPFASLPSWFKRVYNVQGANVNVITPLLNLAPPSPPAPPPPPAPPAPPPFPPGTANNLGAQDAVVQTQMTASAAYGQTLQSSSSRRRGRSLLQTSAMANFKATTIAAMQKLVPTGTVITIPSVSVSINGASSTITVYSKLTFPAGVLAYQAAAQLSQQLSDPTSTAYTSFLNSMSSGGITITGVKAADVTSQVISGAIQLPGKDGPSTCTI